MDTNEFFNIEKLENNHFWYRANRNFSLKLIDTYCHFSTKAQVLDIGCGTGGTTVFLKKYGLVTGVDTSRVALRLAKKHNINTMVGNANLLSFKNSSFDLVTCFDVLYHRDVNIDQAIKEMWKVLKPGGWLLIRVPAFEFLRGGHDVVVHTKKRFTTAKMQVLLREFKIHKLTYFNMSLFLPTLFWRQSHTKSNSDIMPIWPPFNFLLYNLLMLESKLAMKVNLPFGTSVYALAQKL